jgi:prepilin-type N-terminal cleavage/methylation domain-containing protein
MKTELKAKFLQHLTQKKKNEGFTLIELLVVIIIIGILSAIALPSFLNQAAKARGAEAKSNVGSMNRGQQAYFLQQQEFTSAVNQLGLSLKDSPNFAYTAAGSASTAVNFGTSLKDDIKSYSGGVFYTASNGTVEGFTEVILCEANTPGKTAAATPADATATGCTTDAKKVE